VIDLGANQDAYEASEAIGIARGKTATWDATPAAAAATMTRVSHNVRAHRRSGVAQQADDAFFSDAFETLGAVSYEEHKKRRPGEKAN